MPGLSDDIFVYFSCIFVVFFFMDRVFFVDEKVGRWKKMAFDLCLSSEIVLSPLLTLSAYDTMMTLLEEASVTSGFYSMYIEPKTKPNAIRGQV